MTDTRIEALVDSVNARYTDPERNAIISETHAEKPRFELYHFALSVCSHKVRTVLDEKKMAYSSHDIDILPPGMQNYFPEYVRLRLRGGEDLAERMVDGYTGRSSTETEGFDPLVVPTLVDHDAERVLVNSKRMCLYLDEVGTGTRLVPDDIRDEVIRQVDIVDRTPHPGALYGAHPDGKDARPDFIQEGMRGIHDRKIAEARMNMAQVGDDSLLISAYEHKILKESAAKQHVLTEDKMRGTLQEFKDIVETLETDLGKTGGEWIVGDRFTLADAFWAVSLFRMQWLGLGYLWTTGEGARLPGVEAYTRRLYVRPSFQRAVVHWPRNPPSPHVMEYYQ